MITKDGQTQGFKQIKIIIQNSLFQLIQFSILEDTEDQMPQKYTGQHILKKNKLLILFNDQVPGYQLRLLHLISTRE